MCRYQKGHQGQSSCLAFALFLYHARNKSQTASKSVKEHTRVYLNDAKFRYTITIDRKVYLDKLQSDDATLYFLVVCSRVPDTDTRKRLFKDFLIYNVCSVHN